MSLKTKPSFPNCRWKDTASLWIVRNLIPRRVMYWAYITVHNSAWAEAGNKLPDQVSVFDAMKSWANNPGSY